MGAGSPPLVWAWMFGIGNSRHYNRLATTRFIQSRQTIPANPGAFSNQSRCKSHRPTVPHGRARARVKNFTDARPDAKLGKRTAAFKVKMSDILSARPVADSVRDAVAGLFATSVSNVVEGAPKLKITGRVRKFSVETPASLVSWKVETIVEVELQVANEQGAIVHSATYTGQAHHTTATWLGQTIIERTCNEALQQLLKISKPTRSGQRSNASASYIDLNTNMKTIKLLLLLERSVRSKALIPFRRSRRPHWACNFMRA